MAKKKRSDWKDAGAHPALTFGSMRLDDLCTCLADGCRGTYEHSQGGAYNTEEREAVMKANIALQGAIHELKRAGVWFGPEGKK